jgi:hypothetical protein
MFCPNCGQKNIDGNQFCKNCGRKLVSSIEKKVEAIKEPETEKIEILESRVEGLEGKKRKNFLRWMRIVIILAVLLLFYLLEYSPKTFNDLKDRVSSFFSSEQRETNKEAKEKEKRVASYKTFSWGEKSSFKYPPDWRLEEKTYSFGEGPINIKPVTIQKNDEVWIEMGPSPAPAGDSLEELKSDMKGEISSSKNLTIVGEKSDENSFAFEFNTRFDPAEPFSFTGGGLETEEGKEGHGMFKAVHLKDDIYLVVFAVTYKEKWAQYQENLQDIIDSVNIDLSDVSQQEENFQEQLIATDTSSLVLSQDDVGSYFQAVVNDYVTSVEPEFSQDWEQGYQIGFETSDGLKKILNIALRYSSIESAKLTYDYVKDYLPQLIAGSLDEDIQSVVTQPVIIGDVGDESSALEGTGPISERIVYVCFFLKANVVEITMVGSRDTDTWPINETDLYDLSKIIEEKIY